MIVERRRRQRPAGRGAACTAATCVCSTCRSCSRPSVSCARLTVRDAAPPRLRRRRRARAPSRSAASSRRCAPGAAAPARTCARPPSIAARERLAIASAAARRARRATPRTSPRRAPRRPTPAGDQLLDVDVLEPLEHHGSRRSSRSVTTCARTSSSAGRGSVSSAASSSRICSVTSSSRTVPSARVNRRILPRAFAPSCP